MAWEKLGTASVSAATAANTSWKEVGRETLGSAATSMTCSFTPKDNMAFLFFRTSQSTITGNGTMRVGYNSVDSGSNYADRSSSYGNADGTNTNQSGFNEWDTGAVERFDVLNMINITNQEKLIVGEGNILSASGAGTAPFRREYVAKWANTSNQANRFYVAPTTSGTGYAAGTEIVALGYDNDEADSGTNFWQELASVELGSSGTSISSGTFTAKKYLMFELIKEKTGGYVNPKIEFNSDTGSNYAFRYNDNGGSDSTSTSQSNIDMRAGENDGRSYTLGYIINKSDKEKLIVTHTVNSNTEGAGNATGRSEVVGKWANTSSQITSINFSKSASGSFNTGTTLKVYGAD